MKQTLRKIALAVTSVVLFAALPAYAASSVLQWYNGGTGNIFAGSIPFGNGSYTQTSTSSNLTWTNASNNLSFTFGSSTALSATTLCLTGDICRTTWPTGGGANFWTSLGGNIYNNTGTRVQYAASDATSTTATSTITNALTITGPTNTHPGYLNIGTTSPVYGYFPEDLIDAGGGSNDYFAINTYNNVSGSCAQSGFIANGDVPSANNNYFSLMFKNTGWTGSGCAIDANSTESQFDASIFNPTGNIDINIGTTSTSAAIRFIAQGGNTEIARFSQMGTFGIGTTSPFATLSIATTSTSAFAISDQYKTTDLLFGTASTTGSIFTVAATTSPNFGAGLVKLFDVDQYGHLTASSTGATPGISSCGTGSPVMSANANDATGSFVTGTSASSCTITFAHAYATTPIVVVSDSNTSAVVDVSAISTTAFTISLASALSADTVYYIVVMP